MVAFAEAAGFRSRSQRPRTHGVREGVQEGPVELWALVQLLPGGGRGWREDGKAPCRRGQERGSSGGL